MTSLYELPPDIARKIRNPKWLDFGKPRDFWTMHVKLIDEMMKKYALDGLVLISFQVLDVCSVPVRGCPIPRTSCASILRYDSMSHCITPTAVLALWPTRSRCPLRPASLPPSSVPER